MSEPDPVSDPESPREISEEETTAPENENTVDSKPTLPTQISVPVAPLDDPAEKRKVMEDNFTKLRNDDVLILDARHQIKE